MREYLEKNYEETAGDGTVKLALRALIETVEASAKNIEVAVTTRDGGAAPCSSRFAVSFSGLSLLPSPSISLLYRVLIIEYAHLLFLSRSTLHPLQLNLVASPSPPN